MVEIVNVSGASGVSEDNGDKSENEEGKRGDGGGIPDADAPCAWANVNSGGLAVFGDRGSGLGLLRRRDSEPGERDRDAERS